MKKETPELSLWSATQVVLVAKSLVLFLVAGLAEIGGGYLLWQWMRHGKPFWYAVLGAILLIVYGILPNFQPSAMFGRVYAAYGGIFVILSLLWAWKFDGAKPDRPDIWGVVFCLIGVCIIMYYPRK